VVAFMQKPAEPVHDPAVRNISDAFHESDSGEEEKETGED
jgi:hypothetical protein